MKYIAFTKDIAFEGVNNYCHKEYDWSVAKDNPIGLHMDFTWSSMRMVTISLVPGILNIIIKVG